MQHPVFIIITKLMSAATNNINYNVAKTTKSGNVLYIF